VGLAARTIGCELHEDRPRIRGARDVDERQILLSGKDLLFFDGARIGCDPWISATDSLQKGFSERRIDPPHGRQRRLAGGCLDQRPGHALVLKAWPKGYHPPGVEAGPPRLTPLKPDHDLPLRDRELTDDLPQFDGFHRLRSARRRDFPRFFQRPLPMLAPQRSNELPVGDPIQPHSQEGATLKGMQATPRTQERLLGEILRCLLTSGQVKQVTIDAGVVIADELLACLGISVPDLIDEQQISGCCPLESPSSLNSSKRPPLHRSPRFSSSRGPGGGNG
jgi:hypothetical protein